MNRLNDALNKIEFLLLKIGDSLPAHQRAWIINQLESFIILLDINDDDDDHIQ